MAKKDKPAVDETVVVAKADKSKLPKNAEKRVLIREKAKTKPKKFAPRNKAVAAALKAYGNG